MRMTLNLVYFTSLSILLQIFYVTGVSVSWSSPSTIYSSIKSQSVPTYNGNLQQQSTSSTRQPFGISGGTLTSHIDNLNTKMSSNIGLGKNSNTILVKQIGQRDNNDASVSENIITNIQPSEMSSKLSLSSTTIPNFEIPVHFNGPGLSNIYDETNKISDTNRLNEVNNLERSSGSDEGYQLGELNRLSRSISEDGLNLVDSTGVGSNERNEKGLRNKSKIGENEAYGVGKVENYRGGHKSRKNNFVSGTGGSTKFSFEAGKRAKQGIIGEGETRKFGELSRDGGGRMFIGNGEDKQIGRDRGFSASVGSIQFSRKNDGRVGWFGGEEGGDRGFSRSNGSIRFGRKNKSGTGGSSGEKQRDRESSTSNASIQLGRKNGGRAGGSDGEEGGVRGLSRSNGSIRFSSKNKSGTGGLGGVEGNIGVGRSIGSMRFGREKKSREGGLGGEVEEGRGFSGSIGPIGLGRKNGDRARESDGREGGDRGLIRSNGSIRFSSKNNSGIGRLGGEEEGDIGVGRSIGSMRFGREGGSGVEEDEEGRGFSGSVGSISLGRKNKGGTGGSGEENIKFGGEGSRTHKSSISSVVKMNGSGGKKTFGGSVGSTTFGEESGDKRQSKSNSNNINRNIGNYGGRKFDSYIEGNGFSREYGTGEESDGAGFGEFGPEMDEKLKWDD
ncbi:uncharacterized protein LOC100574511 isoform X1 [Acyrthosiphon pisum]|uniref:Uncharacterized protein n=2 Tax=Acyrthosiphon pisum TaxID=7029 RepID=A0A8R1W521_ACYPI|nr:uncharacterized protein LOC100574511 isoform X1 [Acyrthosiphon pisum]|eukprot:XP_003243918.1 PREDICTED: uncharacterized PE-PGRS family protein PE_PGRS20 [Acyrthosiphon pisum]